jgi:glycosyltransferase involved in cell wall biosynthesis
VKKKLNILHLISGLNSGGAEQTLLSLCKDKATNSLVLTLSKNGLLKDQFLENGIPVWEVEIKGPMSLLRAVLVFNKLIKDFKPDIVQAWMYHANLFSCCLKILCSKIPLVWNIRRNNYHASNLKLTTRIIAHCGAILSRWFPALTIYCAHSALFSHAKSGYYKKNAIVVHNGVDTLRFRPDPVKRFELRSTLGIESDTVLVGMVARFIPEKNHELFCKMASRLKTGKIKMKFLFCGLGISNDNTQLMAIVTKYSLEEDLILLGSTRAPEFVYPALDVHVLCSKSEGFPNVIAEAMACGIRVVSTDCGDAKYIIKNPLSIVSGDDPELLCQAVLDCLDSEVKLSITQAEEQFSVKYFCHSYLKAWLSLLPSKPQ